MDESQERILMRYGEVFEKKGSPKATGEDQYRSIYSMAFLDFERLHRLMCEIDMFGKQFEAGDNTALRPYLVVLKRFYLNVRHLSVERDKIDSMFMDAEGDVDRFEDSRAPPVMKPILLKQCKISVGKLTTMIYELKQKIGLGMLVEKELSQTKKWERAMRME